MIKINSSEITPEHNYVSRRDFIIGAGAITTSILLFGSCGNQESVPGPNGSDFCKTAYASKTTDELGGELTACESVINYNNYYEFTTNKENVAHLIKSIVIHYHYLLDNFLDIY